MLTSSWFQQSNKVPNRSMLSSILAFRFNCTRKVDTSLSGSRPDDAGDALDNILCKLPIDVARKLLSDFSDIVDIVRLDSAALVHQHRELFKLRYKGITVECSEFVQFSLSTAQWLSSREIYVRAAQFDCTMIDQWQNGSPIITREVSKVLIQRKAEVVRSGELERESVRVVCQNCPKLQELCITVCELDTDLLRNVMLMCPLLTEVDFTWSNVHAGNIEPLLSPRIVSLSLMRCQDIDDAAVAMITSSCTGLRTLVLGYCRRCTRAAVDSVARNCPQLEVLGLQCFRELPDATIAALAAGCTNLREIHFQLNETLTSEGILAIASHCTKLTTITLLHCKQVRTEAIGALVSRCPNLRSVDIHADCAVVVALSQHCPHLREADLMWSAHHSNNMVTYEVLTQLLRQCQALTSLSVQSFSGSPPCDVSFTSSVEELYLNWGAQGVDYEISGIFKFLPKLREVCLCSLDHVGDHTVLQIAAHCPLLERVDFGGLDRLTDASIIALSRACPLLSDVCLNNCPRLTDRAVVSIAQHCPQLTHLDVFNFYRDDTVLGTAMAFLRGKYLGDASIAALATHSKHLMVLDVKGNPRISKSALRALATALPWCKVNHEGD